MKNLHNIMLVIMTSALLLSADLMAEPPQGKHQSEKMGRAGLRAFSIHDADNNGFLSKDEYHHFIEQKENRRKTTGRPMRRFSSPLSFKEIDINKDGQLSEAELIDALNKRLREHRRYRRRGGDS